MTHQELVRAIEADDLGALERCLQSDGAVDALRTASEKGGHVLHVAAQCGSAKAVELLLRAGADVNQTSAGSGAYPGYTAVHYAALKDNDGALRVLVDAKADLDRPAADGWHAVHIAAYKCKHAALATLLEAGADVNARLPNGLTPLALAADRGHLRDVRLLLKYGADTSFSDAKGNTLMHYALHYQMSKLFTDTYPLPEGQLDVAVTLALHGAPADVHNSDGHEAAFFLHKSFPSLQSTLSVLTRHAALLRRAPREWNFLSLVAAPADELARLGLSEDEAAGLHEQLCQLNTDRQARRSAIQRKNDSAVPPAAEGVAVRVPPNHPPVTAEMLRSGVDPSGGRCPFFQKQRPVVPEADKPLCPFSRAFVRRHRVVLALLVMSFLGGVCADQLLTRARAA